MYTISFDAPSRTLRLKLEGLWSAATLAGFAAELLVKATAARLRYGDFALLSDASEFPVQTPGIAEGFAGILARGAKVHNGRVAIVVASVLNKIQAERTLKSPRVRVFLSPDEARQWLASDSVR